MLYHAEQKNAHHIYMALIVILILTQNEEFNTAVHELVCALSLVTYKLIEI